MQIYERQLLLLAAEMLPNHKAAFQRTTPSTHSKYLNLIRNGTYLKPDTAPI